MKLLSSLNFINILSNVFQNCKTEGDNKRDPRCFRSFSSFFADDSVHPKRMELSSPRWSLLLAPSSGAPACARFWCLLSGRAFSTFPRDLFKRMRAKREKNVISDDEHNVLVFIFRPKETAVPYVDCGMQRCWIFALVSGVVRKGQDEEVRASAEVKARASTEVEVRGSGEVFADGEASTSVAAPGDSCVVLCDVPAASLSMESWIPQLKEYCRGKRMVILDPGLRDDNASNLYDVQKYDRPEDVPLKEENFPKSRNMRSGYWSQVGVSSYTSVPIVANSTISKAVLERAGVEEPAPMFILTPS